MANDSVKTLLEEWERAKLGAKEFIEAMPDDKLNFRPVPEVLTFAGQFLHVADANYIFGAGAFGIENPQQGKSEEKPELQAKPALTEFVLASYDFVVKGIGQTDPASFGEEVAFFKWTMPRYLVLAKAMEHHAHHRGQSVVYFRLNGMKPPSERLF